MNGEGAMQARFQILVEQVQGERLTRVGTHFMQEGRARHAVGRETIDVVEGEAIRRAVVQRGAGGTAQADHSQQQSQSTQDWRQTLHDPFPHGDHLPQSQGANATPLALPNRDLLLQRDVEALVDAAAYQINQA